MIQSDLCAEGYGGVLHEGLASAEGAAWVINPTDETIAELLTLSREQQPAMPTPVRLLAASDSLQRTADDFPRASRAADLVSEGHLELRALPSAPHHSLLLTERAVVSFVECDGQVAGLTTTREDLVTSTRETYVDRWERAEEFTLRTPPLSEVRQTLASEFGPVVAGEFDRALAALDRHRQPASGDDPVDGVSLALLVAANNRELLYDISRWGESVRLASKATFSRGKKRLEDADLLDTEKVPIDVGRPRLRLVPADPLADADIESLVREARERLS